MTTAQERKQQERTARRRRIQRAARTVFAEKGYAKTSIEQIAREASLSVGAIYLYFRSKEDLYVSLLEETLDLFDTELRQIRGRSEVAAPERLRQAWSFLTQWAATDVEASRVLRLIAQPNIRTQLSDEVVESIGKGLTQVREHLTGIVQEGSQAGVYHRAPQAAVDVFWSLFIGVLEASDARANLDMPGATYAELSQAAFSAIDAAVRAPEGSQAAAAEVAA
jgi:AcrR family transcriptional regulator